ncbi:MAG: hypothetical protein ACK58U_15985 [Rubrivivax sp.]|jgi:hypothetical protein
MSDVITLEKVLSSKVYVQEKSQISFGSPKQYIEPFLEKLNNAGATFRVAVSERSANKEESGQTNEAFGRVLVEAKLPQEYTAFEHDSVIGLVYALDTQKPVIKVYSGQNAWACTNLAIFGASYLHEVQIMQGYSSVYEKALTYVEEVGEQLTKFKRNYETLNNRILRGNQIDEQIGYLLRESYRNKQIGTTPIISAVKDLEDPKTRYGIQNDETTQWNIYSAVTQYVTDKVDIAEKASKTVMISKLFLTEL